MIGYITRANVEGFLNRTFPEVDDSAFNIYISAAETIVNNYIGVNSQTTLSGVLSENVVNERSLGKVDSFNNIIIDIRKPPVHMDANDTPLVQNLRFEVGVVRVPLNLVVTGAQVGSTSPIEVSENRRTLVYPSLYFLPALSTVTPSAKLNLFNIASIKFWTVIDYTGGYDSVPDDIKMATNYIVGDLLLHRDNPLFMTSMSQGSMSQSFGGRASGGGSGFSIARMLLQPYVRYTW